MKLNRWIALALTLPCSCVFAKTHTLKKGETLASVARKYYGEPVFGPKGTIKKIYAMNPWAEKSPNIVEPGKEIILADTETPPVAAASSKPADPPAVPVPPAHHGHGAPPSPPAPPVINADAIAAQEKKSWDQKAVEDANAAAAAQAAQAPAEPAKNEAPPAVVEAPKCEACEKMQSSTKNEVRDSLTFAEANEFFVIPYYSMSKISLTNPSSGTSYDINSTSSYGARLGWGHRFNKSVSALFEANTMIWNSDATNASTGAIVADKVSLYKVEAILANQIGEKSRFGVGVSYGNKLFIENFDAAPANQTVATFTSVSPIVMAKFSLYDSSTFGIPLTLKWSPLSADLDKGVAPGIKAGHEVTARLMFNHKMMNNEVTYGVTYLTNNQAENNRTQQRTDTNVEFGMVF